jgi:hypothetical protein
MIISLGFELPRTSSDLPEDLGRASRSPILRGEPAGVFLFGLASGDAYRAGDVAIPAVGSYPTVSPLPDPQRLDWDPIALAIGGLFSVVLVSDHSAWVLPSALPKKSGLSSRRITATSDHPVFSLAPSYYRARCPRFQDLPRKNPSALAHPRQQRRRHRGLGLVHCHGFRHPLIELFNPRFVAGVRRHEFCRRPSAGHLSHSLP